MTFFFLLLSRQPGVCWCVCSRGIREDSWWLPLMPPPGGRKWRKSGRSGRTEAAARGSCSPCSSELPLRRTWKVGCERPPAAERGAQVKMQQHTFSCQTYKWATFTCIFWSLPIKVSCKTGITKWRTPVQKRAEWCFCPDPWSMCDRSTWIDFHRAFSQRSRL